MTAITRKQNRQKNDFYPTPAWATEVLCDRVGIGGSVFECCAGDGDISRVLKTIPGAVVHANDIDEKHSTDFHVDLSNRLGWEGLDRPDWTVTNPPFKHAPEMVQLAFHHSVVGVAMLLRLSFLEPCKNRGEFLAKNPPTTLLVLPRISFTGDGRTDSTTCAWFVWDKSKMLNHQKIEIVSFM